MLEMQSLIRPCLRWIRPRQLLPISKHDPDSPGPPFGPPGGLACLLRKPAGALLLKSPRWGGGASGASLNSSSIKGKGTFASKTFVSAKLDPFRNMCNWFQLWNLEMWDITFQSQTTSSSILFEIKPLHFFI